jgi:hypothetical protein
MSRYQFQSNINSLVELDVDTNRVCGSGGADYPFLYWQMELLFSPRRSPHNDYALRHVDAQLHFPSAQKIADARPIVMNRIIRGPNAQPFGEWLTFEFPLDARRIEAFERYRKAGSLKLRLDIQLWVDEFAVVIEPVPHKRTLPSGLSEIHRFSLQQEMQIEQSHWFKVLAGLGYGQVHIVEFPAAPLLACAALDHSFKALNQAVDAHREGRYDDAAGKCRIALDPFFEYEERTEPDGSKRKIPILKKSWETRVGRGTYLWLAESLTAIKIATNPAHHTPHVHFDQLESQMLLAVTSALLNYAARIDTSDD